MKKKALYNTIIALALTLAALASGLRIRARFLPTVDVPILLYERVAQTSEDKDTVPLNLFYQQMRDLSANGYKTVSPERLLAYKVWGLALPELPLMITFDKAYRDLQTTVAPILKEQNFTAVVNLATTYIGRKPDESRALNGIAMMSWAEVRDALKADVFSFGGHTRNLVDLTRHEKPFNEIRASRTDIKRATGVKTTVFSYPFGKYSPALAKAAKEAKIDFAMTYGNTIAKIGPKTDFLALPRIQVVGGNHTFSATVIERQSPGQFGVVKVSHPQGVVFPMSVVVFGSDSYKPVADFDCEGIKSDETIEVSIPSKTTFPVDVEILDKNRVLLYFKNSIPRNAVQRDPTSTGAPVNLDYKVDIEPIL